MRDLHRFSSFRADYGAAIKSTCTLRWNSTVRCFLDRTLSLLVL